MKRRKGIKKKKKSLPEKESKFKQLEIGFLYLTTSFLVNVSFSTLQKTCIGALKAPKCDSYSHYLIPKQFRLELSHEKNSNSWYGRNLEGKKKNIFFLFFSVSLSLSGLFSLFLPISLLRLCAVLSEKENSPAATDLFSSRLFIFTTNFYALIKIRMKNWLRSRFGKLSRKGGGGGESNLAQGFVKSVLKNGCVADWRNGFFLSLSFIPLPVPSPSLPFPIRVCSGVMRKLKTCRLHTECC